MFDPATLRFDDRGLIPAIAQDHASGEVLMLAWMTADAVARTLAEGRVTYWSRSRAAFWTKGETSGHTQRLVEYHAHYRQGRPRSGHRCPNARRRRGASSERAPSGGSP